MVPIGSWILNVAWCESVSVLDQEEEVCRSFCSWIYGHLNAEHVFFEKRDLEDPMFTQIHLVLGVSVFPCAAGSGCLSCATCSRTGLVQIEANIYSIRCHDQSWPLIWLIRLIFLREVAPSQRLWIHHIHRWRLRISDPSQMASRN